MQKIDPILKEICTKVIYELSLMEEKDSESKEDDSDSSDYPIEDPMDIANAFKNKSPQQSKQQSETPGNKYNLQTNQNMKSK